MPTVYIPDPDSLLRYVRSRLVRRDEETGKVIGFLPQAFELRHGEDDLSASWVEFFEGTPSAQLAAAIEECACELEVKKNDRFARGIVGRIKEVCLSAGLKVRITHEGGDYPSHSFVRQFRTATLEVLELLAAEAWAEAVTPPVTALNRKTAKS